MPKIKVYFSDGTFEIFHEEQTFMTFSNKDSNWQRAGELTDKVTIIRDKIGLHSQENTGLRESLFEILANSDYFCDVENPDIIYSKNAVVKFEMI